MREISDLLQVLFQPDVVSLFHFIQMHHDALRLVYNALREVIMALRVVPTH